jgi:hypothetical protein
MKDWTNSSAWFQKVPEEAVLYKTMILKMIVAAASHNQTTTTEDLTLYFKDVDVSACILARYLYQREDLLKYPELLEHLKDIKSARYILKEGCLEPISNYIFKAHPSLLSDESIIKRFAKTNSRGLHVFAEQLKDINLINKFLGQGIVAVEFLTYHPQNLDITKLLFEKGLYPQAHNKNLYSPEVYKDKELIKKALLNDYGYMLYSRLPDELQNDIEICDAVISKHPHVNVKVSSIDTIDKFLASLESDASYAKELYTVSSNMQKHDFIMNDMNNLAKIFDRMKSGKFSSHVELMGEPQFSGHDIQDLFKKLAKKHKIIKEFLQTDFGSDMINMKIKNYGQFLNFETKVIPKISEHLTPYIESYNRKESLEDSLAVKNEKTKIVKL